MNHCPPSDLLEQLLAGDTLGPTDDPKGGEPCATPLSEPTDLREVRAHVRVCRACQAILDRLADDEDLRGWYPGTALPTPPTAEGPGLVQLVERLRSAKEVTEITALPPAAPAGLHALLGPPRREGEVGTLGQYAVQVELGRGGMGIVFRARDEALERTVALKILRPELLSERARLRFVGEAQAAARLRHAHVVGVYAVFNPPEGSPYFAMEYVAGQTLAQLLRTRGWLEPRQAADLAEQMAEGLAAAHGAGLVHRDVKPGNVLLEEAPGGLRARITDFGLARRLDAADRQTQTGTILGTPCYMAPEQASGVPKQVGPPADIYALGATLYEMLTGRPPLLAEGPLETVLQVLHQEPIAPRRLRPTVPPDLETICLKCLEKEPRRRYSSARALADDLGRWQRGEPIHARPVGVPGRVLRWGRRKPLLAALAGALVLALTVGVGGILWQWQRAEDNAELADARARDVEANLKRAHRQLRENVRIVHRFSTQVAESPELRQGKLAPLRRKLMESALEHLQRFLEEWGDYPGLREDAARVSSHVGTITAAIGRIDEALTACGDAAGRYEELLRRDPTRSDLRTQLFSCYTAMGTLYQDAGNFTRAAQCFEQARAEAQRLTRDQPNNAVHLSNLAASWGNLAGLHTRLARPREALAAYERARTALKSLLQDDPDHLGSLRNLALTENNRALLLPPDESLAALQRARALRERLRTLAPGSTLYRRDLARTDQHLGGQLVSRGRRDEGFAHFRQAVDALEDLVRTEPANTEFIRNLAQVHLNFGTAQGNAGQPAAALRSYGRCRDLHRQLLLADAASTPSQQQLAFCYKNIWIIDRRLHKEAEALRSWEEGRDFFVALVGKHPDNAGLHATLADVQHFHAVALWEARRPEEAVSAVRQAITQECLAKLPARRGDLSDHYRLLAGMLRERGRPAEAVAAVRERNKLWPGNPAEQYDVACDLARCVSLLGSEEGELTPRQQDQRQAYVAEALAVLGEAIRHGYKDLDRLRTDPALAPLRAHPDFARLSAAGPSARQRPSP